MSLNSLCLLSRITPSRIEPLCDRSLCVRSFTLLAEAGLDWEFNYRSHYLRYRGLRSLTRTLSTNWFDLFIWAVLVRQQAMARVLWSKCDEPLRAALIASISCRKAAEETSGKSAIEMEEHADTYEEWAIGLIRHETTLDMHAQSMLLMQLPRSRMKTGTSREILADKWVESPLEVAIGFGQLSCRSFLATRRCRLFLTHVFCGYDYGIQYHDHDGDGMATANDYDDEDVVDDDLARDEEDVFKDGIYFPQRATEKWLKSNHMLEMQIPLIGILYVPKASECVCHGPSYLRPLEQRWQQLRALFSVPKVKFTFHLFASFVYYFFFVYVILGLSWAPWYGQRNWMREGHFAPLTGGPFVSLQHAHGPNVARTPSTGNDSASLEIALWAWTILRLVEEVKQMYRQGVAGYAETENPWKCFAYFQSALNWIDVFNSFSVVASMVIRVSVSIAPHSIAPSHMVMYMQAVQCLYALAGITIIVRCAFSLSIFENFGVLWLMIIRMAWDVVNWLLVVFFISLGFGVAYTILMPGQTFEYDRPFFRPFWGLLGDFDTESIDEYFPLDPTFVISHELTMILTWGYTFFTTILLVNLLIAQMGYALHSQTPCALPIHLDAPLNQTCAIDIPPCCSARRMRP